MATSMKSCALGATQIGFVLVVTVFGIGQCVGDTKSMLACVGIGRGSSQPSVEVRALDVDHPDDHRLATSLLRLSEIAGLTRQEVRAVVVVSKQVNAANLGPTQFALFEGLYRVSDESLDAIMAHEVAHAQLGHVEAIEHRAKTIDRATRIVGALVGVDSEGRDEVAGWALGAALPSFSREQELEADARAVDLLRQSGYGSRAPSVMCSALEDLRALDGGEDSDGFWSTHPSTDDRLQRIRALTRE
jgi:predicted Zn-dependent protease